MIAAPLIRRLVNRLARPIISRGDAPAAAYVSTIGQPIGLLLALTRSADEPDPDPGGQAGLLFQFPSNSGLIGAI